MNTQVFACQKLPSMFGDVPIKTFDIGFNWIYEIKPRRIDNGVKIQQLFLITRKSLSWIGLSFFTPTFLLFHSLAIGFQISPEKKDIAYEISKYFKGVIDLLKAIKMEAVNFSYCKSSVSHLMIDIWGKS